MAQAAEPPAPSVDAESAAAPKPSPAGPEERLQQAEKLREDGNTKFKGQDLKAAQQDYEAALALLDPRRPGLEGELAARALACRTPVLLNLALCCLKAEPIEACRALELCEEALDNEPENPKATYRKAKALLELGEEKEAEWELVRACKLMPKDPAVRKDLEQLRRRMKESAAKEKATYQGLFEKSPGFASDRREQAGGPAGSKISEKDLGDLYFHDSDDNPFEGTESPWDRARELQAGGQLADAAMAWEAALSRAAADGDWPAHFSHCLDFGRLFLNLNVDRLALRCFDKVLEPPEPAAEPDGSAPAPSPAPLAETRQHALLLRAVCLLNEAEGDPQAEVSACLGTWLSHACKGCPRGLEGAAVEQRIVEWRQAEGAQAGADAAVALGLLQLLRGEEAALDKFADALRAPEDSASCFGGAHGLAVRWNMLGAVLANRKRYEHALAAYSQALRLLPKYPRALINRGLAHSGHGEFLEAAASYAEALELVPAWSAQAVWPLLETAVEDSGGNEELAEAAKARNLTGAREVLASAGARPAEPAKAEEPVADVLARIGLAA